MYYMVFEANLNHPAVLLLYYPTAGAGQLWIFIMWKLQGRYTTYETTKTLDCY